MPVYVLQVNGTRGEVTPYMHARVDTDFYRAAFQTARNTVITRYGPHTRVPGTLHDGFAKYDDRRARFLPFEFTETEVYSIEAGHEYFRFWTPLGQIVDGSDEPYEIETPYQEADLPFLHGRQSGDVVYLFCKGYRPTILKRLADDDWELEDYVPLDGPYMDMNDTATTLTPASTGHATPAMTGASTPSGTVTTTGVDGWKVFDRNLKTNTRVGPDNTSFGQVTYDFGDGNAKVVDNYWLTAGNNNDRHDDFPKQWDFQGSHNGTDWIIIDTRDGERGLAGGETRFYETTNKVAFRYYRFDFSGGGGDDNDDVIIAEIALHQAAEDQTPFNLTASSTTGINDDQGFLPTDVGRAIRLVGPNGKWHWCEITDYVSATVVKVVMHGHALRDTSPIQDWALGKLSDTTGWPTTGAFFEDRLVLAGGPEDPIGLWLSVNADYDSFRTSQPGVDDDGLSIRLTGGKLDPIHWLAESGILLAGTGGNLRSIGGRDNSDILKSTNIRQRSETAVPSSAVQPAVIENAVLFVDRFRKRLYEAAYSYEADGFVAREVSILNEHLFSGGVEQIVFMDTPHKILWVRRDDGGVTAFTYDREQKVAGATDVSFGGFVEDLMVLPGAEYPDLWMIVRRETANGIKRHIERLGAFFRDDVPGFDVPVYGASSYVHLGETAESEFSGAVALAGQTCGVWADGRDLGDVNVSALGAFTLPGGIEATNVVVGLRMPWQIKTMRLPEIGNQDGSGLGRKARIVSAYIDLFQAAGVNAGSLNIVDPVRFEDEIEDDPTEPPLLRDGMWKFPIDDSYQNAGVLVIEGDRMYPATVRGITVEVDGEP